MAASINIAIPIFSLRVVGTVGAQAPIRRIIEKASQTFLVGTPVQIDTGTGSVQACPAITSAATAVIAGMSCDYAANLATTGVPQTQNQRGNPPNQPSAVFTAVGAWPNDGTTGFIQALDQNIFVGRLGNSVTAATSVVLVTDLGKLYGLTQDAGNLYWYVDKGITTTAAGACVQITDIGGPGTVLNATLDPIGTLNGKVGFVVTAAAQQIY
jgi:hypothetical protein